VEDWVVAAVAGDGDDFGFAGGASLGVLDAIGFGRVVRSELAVADDDLEVGCLVQAFGFAGCKARNDAFQGDVGVGASDVAGGGVVGAGRSGFDVRDGLAPVGKDAGRD